MTKTKGVNHVRRWVIIIIAAVLCNTLYFVLPFDDFACKGLELLAFIGLLWLTEALPVTVTAMLVPIIAVIAGLPGAAVRDATTNALLPNAAEIPGITFKQVMANFADPTILLFFGGFGLATALHVQKLDKKIANGIMTLAGGSLKRSIFGIIIICLLLSMWISNTACAVMMLPLVIGMFSELPADQDFHNTKVFSLLGVAYACSIGGIGTLVGSPPNAIAAAALDMSFAEWLKVGLPVMLILAPLMLVTLWLVFKPKFSAKLSGHVTTDQMEKIPWTAKRILTMVIFVITALLWIFNDAINDAINANLSEGLTGLLAVVLVLALDLVKWKDISDGTEWGVLILFGGGLALSQIMQNSGASYTLAMEVKDLVGNMPPIVIIGAVSLFIILLTEFTSNTASAALLVPVFGAIAVQLGMPEETLVMVIGIGASCAFMLPVATPPNAVVFGTGEIRSSEMLKAGTFLNLLCVVALTLYTYFFLM